MQVDRLCAVHYSVVCVFCSPILCQCVRGCQLVFNALLSQVSLKFGWHVFPPHIRVEASDFLSCLIFNEGLPFDERIFCLGLFFEQVDPHHTQMIVY